MPRKTLPYLSIPAILNHTALAVADMAVPTTWSMALGAEALAATNAWTKLEAVMCGAGMRPSLNESLV